MKQLITTLTFTFLVAFAVAQAPDIMNYQAVARNTSGQALANQSIRVKLSVLKNAILQYSETRQVATNALGLFNVQIGSAGALSTTGNFAGINWQDNGTPGYVLKVELDVNSSGNFIDMGSQALVTVPYAFASKTATETINIAGRPVDQTATPTVGSRLSWNGTSWTPVKKDTVINVAGNAVDIPAGGGNAPWIFLYTPQVVTVTGEQRIMASIGAGLGNPYSSSIPVSYSLCYQSTVAGSPINSFFGITFPDGIARELGKTHISSAGAISLPPGQYRIGLAIKNRSNAGAILSGNTEANGIIEIRN